MNDIYSTMHKLTADLIETAYPTENEGKISPVSLKCEITRGNVTYSVTNERDSKGNYESNIRADTEDKAKKKPLFLEAVKAAGHEGITLTADNIRDFDFSGCDVWYEETEANTEPHT